MGTKKTKRVRTDAEKRADFKAIAGKHAGTALAAIGRLTKCARPSRYSWTPEQISKLENAFKDALSACFGQLKAPPSTGGKKAVNPLD